MKTFSDRWRQLDWDDIHLRINGKTAADVEAGAKCLATHPRRHDGIAITRRQWLSLEPLAQRGATHPDSSAIWQRRRLLRPALSFQSLR